MGEHLEGSYFPLHVLRGLPGAEVWYVDHRSRYLERSAHCNTLVVRATLEHHGIALFGPEARTLFASIPVDALRAEIRTTLVDWGQEILAAPDKYDNRFYQGFIVLSYCRMLHDLETGQVGSKRGGANWAKANLPERWHSLIDRSWFCRPDPFTSSRTKADPADFAETLELVRFAADSVL